MAQGGTTGRDPHPNDDLLLALHDGVLFPGDRPVVEGHIKTCARCQARLKALTEDTATTTPGSTDTAVLTLPAAAPVRTAGPSVLGAVLKRLVAVVVVFGVLGAAAILARREFARRSSEPISLAATPATPERAAAPAIANPPAPAPTEAVAPPAVTTAAAPTTTPDAATSPAAAVDSIVITSPNRNFRWRVVGRDVERTTNAGGDWRKQDVSVTRTITAGAAPSAAVCWLVGRGGAIFVAIGAQWKDVSMADPVDLVRVAAIDSMNATVTAADGRQFSSSDAGLTWIAVAP